MSKATIYDVAGAARVSLATVSRAINNPEKVKPETRERVLRVIEELGVRIDYIGGTSTGAIVGGLYAVGYSAVQIDSIFKEINFSELIQDDFNEKNLEKELHKILNLKNRQAIFLDYFELEKKLGGKGASKKVAELIIK